MFMVNMVGSVVASAATYVGCQSLSCFSTSVMKTSARVAYCFLFAMAMLLAWIIRDFGKPLLEKIPWIVRHFTGEPSDAWFGVQAVYRISMGNFLFFATLSAILIGVKFRSDKRAQFLMSGSSGIKLGLWAIFNILPFFLPNDVIFAYGWLARVGSFFFLIIQMFILLDFVMSTNDSWVRAGEEDERFFHWLLAATIGCYVGCCVLAGLLFFWFKPDGAGSCTFNVTVITMSILLFVAFSIVSMSPWVASGSLFPSAVISIYCMYLAYGALQSEPHTELCNGLGHKIDAASGSTLAVGMIIMLFSVIYSAFKAGSNTHTFSLSREEAMESAQERLLEEGGTSAGLDGRPNVQAMTREGPAAAEPRAMDEFVPVSYNYSFFHLVFALASMYIAMLLTGWGSGSEKTELMDVGWPSVYMKLLTQWGTGMLYVWVIIAPAILKDRDFS